MADEGSVQKTFFFFCSSVVKACGREIAQFSLIVIKDYMQTYCKPDKQVNMGNTCFNKLQTPTTLFKWIKASVKYNCSWKSSPHPHFNIKSYCRCILGLPSVQFSYGEHSLLHLYRTDSKYTELILFCNQQCMIRFFLNKRMALKPKIAQESHFIELF